MNKSEQKRFDELYRKHLRALNLQGMSGKTIDGYPRAVRRIAAWFDCCPDRLKPEQLAGYFSELVESHSSSTVKLERCGMQFFLQACAGSRLAVGGDDPATKALVIARYPECCRARPGLQQPSSAYCLCNITF